MLGLTVPAPVAAPVAAPVVARQTEQTRNNFLLGNPSRAMKSDDNYLVERPQHALSYNRSKGTANWVSWHLDKNDLGSVRRGTFSPDSLLPPEMQIRPTDYRGSGYDRGHICPSGDRTATKTDNTATFVMSNMLPQAAELNQHVWNDLEEYSRYLVRQSGAKASELYIISGGSGTAGRIADGKINIPAVCWKIILVLPVGDNDLKRINAKTRVIAVAMPNRKRPEIALSKWPQWVTSVAKIEKTTGYDFLSALPDPIEKALAIKVDPGRASGEIDKIAKDYEAGNRRNVPHVMPPDAKSATNQASPSASQNDAQVWVNTKSGVYHFSGTRYYGNTKEGKYMNEKDAIAAGYRANGSAN